MRVFNICFQSYIDHNLMITMIISYIFVDTNLKLSFEASNIALIYITMLSFCLSVIGSKVFRARDSAN